MAGKRVKVIGPKGHGTVPEEQLDQAMRQGYFPVDEPNQEKSWVETTWDRFNKGLVSPDAWLGWASGLSKDPLTIQKLEKMRDQAPSAKESSSQAFARTFHSGMTADLARTASSLTSPASITTAGLSSVAKVPGAVGAIARSLLTTQGLAYGAKGLGDVASGLEKGPGTPEGAEKLLGGGAEILGAAPSVMQMKRVAEGGMARVMPGIFARERRAFMGSLRPTIKDAPALSDAYDVVKSDLQKAQPKDFMELRDLAETNRRKAAADLSGEILKRSPNAGKIDPRAVGAAVRQRITPWMRLRESPMGELPAEAKMIEREASAIETQLARNPMTIAQAEHVIQDINAELSKFRKMTPQAQYQAIRQGDPSSVMTAVKDALQDQIEASIKNYPDLKKRYGAYKEIQTQTEKRIDDLDRTSGNMDWTTRRAVEGAGMAMGALFSRQFLHELADVMTGRVAGDFAIEGLRRPERMLKRGVAPPRAGVPFAGQLTQTAPQGVLDSGSSGASTDEVLNHLFGAPGGR
jgi:hypothetical protein